MKSLLKKMRYLRTSFVLGLIGGVSIFLNAVFAFLAANAFFVEFGQVEKVRTYVLMGGVFLVVGFLAVLGCIKGKKVGSYSMVIAGVLMLIILQFYGWFPAAFLIAGAYAAGKEIPISKKDSEISKP